MMRQNLKQKNRKTELTMGISIGMLFLSAIYITITTFMIQPGAFGDAMRYAFAQPLVLLLNFLPPLVLSLFFWFFFKKMFFGIAVTCFLFQAFSYINNLKVAYRADPFVPRDFLLIREAMTATGDYKLEMNVRLIGIMVLSLAFFLLLGRWFKSYEFSKRSRVVGVAGVVVTAVLLNAGIYSSRDLYFNQLKKSNVANVASVYSELGFTYCFLFNFSAYPVEKPKHFDKIQARAWNEEETTAVLPKKKPHIIFVMNEAFSELTNEDVFIFGQEEDPLKNYNCLKASDQTISGNLVVPNFGGGTANTEFDILTGLQTNMISNSGPSAFRIVRNKMQTMARLLETQGYQSFFLHPGESWFYNRVNVYNSFGMEDQIFADAFQPEDYKGTNRRWIKDEACAERLIQEFETRTKNSDEPIFSYVVSIENHTAYHREKFGKLSVPKVKTTRKVSGTVSDYLDLYTEGIRDADQMLARLTEYFEETQEPVILAFYGDHLPNLGTSYMAYRELGLDIGYSGTVEENLKTYSPPFILWANKKAYELLDLEEKKETLKLPNEGKLSANYFGAMVLEYTGFSGLNPYFDFLNEMRKEIPVAWKEDFITKEASFTGNLTEEERVFLEKMHCWQYYKLKYEKIK